MSFSHKRLNTFVIGMPAGPAFLLQVNNISSLSRPNLIKLLRIKLFLEPQHHHRVHGLVTSAGLKMHLASLRGLAAGTATLESVLEQHFQLKAFRSGQRDVSQ